MLDTSSPISFISRIISVYKPDLCVTNTTCWAFFFAYRISAATTLPLPIPVWSPKTNPLFAFNWSIAKPNASICSEPNLSFTSSKLISKLSATYCLMSPTRTSKLRNPLPEDANNSIGIWVSKELPFTLGLYLVWNSVFLSPWTFLYSDCMSVAKRTNAPIDVFHCSLLLLASFFCSGVKEVSINDLSISLINDFIALWKGNPALLCCSNLFNNWGFTLSYDSFVGFIVGTPNISAPYSTCPTPESGVAEAPASSGGVILDFKSFKLLAKSSKSSSSFSWWYLFMLGDNSGYLFFVVSYICCNNSCWSSIVSIRVSSISFCK